MTDQTLETTQTIATEEDPFSAMFDSLTAPKTEVAAPVAPAAPAAVEETQFIDPEAQQQAQAEAAAQQAQAAAAQVGDQAAAAAAQQAQASSAMTSEEFQRHFAAMMQAAQQGAPQQPVQQPAAPSAPIFTPDQVKTLQQYHTDFPDVAAAERLLRHQDIRQVATHLLGEMANALKSRDETIQYLLERQQLADLRGALPDYDGMREKVGEWANQQPSYLRKAYNDVITSGTEEEVVDLFKRYQQATGAAALPPVTPAPAAQAPQPATELPAATKQAVAALAPVGSKRSAVVRGLPTTFDEAFDLAASRNKPS